MNPKVSRSTFSRQTFRSLVAVLCVALLVPVDSVAWAWSPQQQAGGDAEQAPKIPNDQLDSLVAPIALYPDPLLAQVLVASTYPLEIIQLQQWLDRHKDLKDKALADAVQKEAWDPSIQSLAALPQVVKLLSENIKWTTDLGNAFLAQQGDVMDAVQRMRAKAQGSGKLKSTEQQKVETRVVENKTVVVIEPAQPNVVYVPSYDPVVVYGAAPVYAYPPMVYPPGYAVAGMALSFGVGMMMGAAWGGGWCCNAGWGGNNININNNNNFVRNSNRQTGNRPSNQPARGGSGNWQHNPQHRGGTPYSNRATANKYGGTARGDSMANRQASARQNQGQMGGRQQPGSMDRGSRQQPSTMDRGAGNRTPSAGGGGDRVGNRSVSGGGSARDSSAFGGGGAGSGSGARASSARGGSSMGGGGGRGGGGARGGGGGGRRR